MMTYFVFYKIEAPRSHVVDVIKNIDNIFFCSQFQQIIDADKSSSASNTSTMLSQRIKFKNLSETWRCLLVEKKQQLKLINFIAFRIMITTVFFVAVK